jgi:general secretion pathway protein I
MKLSQATGLGQAGFTLLEVLVALGILATAYVALLQTLSGSIRLSTYGRQVTVAAFLAQAKLEQTEEKLIKDGFPVDSDVTKGTFEESGYPGYRWKMEVRKIELPIGDALNYLMSDRGGKDDKKNEALNKALGRSVGNLFGSGGSGLAGLLGGSSASALGQAGGSGMTSAALSTLGGSAEMISKQIEEQLREMQLTVEWGEGGPGRQLVVTTHIVNIPQAPAAAGAQPALTPSPGGPGLNLTNPAGSALPVGN